MKKQFTHLALLVFSAFTILSSCNKAEVRDQLAAPTSDESSSISARGGHCGCCPATAPEATSISYSLSTWAPVITIAADIFYTNPDADGTFRVVLKNVNGEIKAIDIVDAAVVDPGHTGTFQLNYSVPPDEFPCKLHVHGRPSNLDCDLRNHKVFTIETEVSKHQ